LTLEELCRRDSDQEKTSDPETGSDKLGVLRMDVDNLGNLFMHGLEGPVPGQGASFSSLATLSSLFDQFFGGYLNTIREKEAFRNHVNIVYSGGDDIFAVGRWDKLLNFAIEIRHAFRKYVCDRDDISLSGGLAIVRPKFPISKAAEISGSAEDLAKTNQFLIDGKILAKNAMTIFGIAINWEKEMPFVVECKNDLVNWIHHRKIISKGLLMKMFTYYEAHLQGDISWKWQSAYTLARIAESNDKDHNKELRQIVDILRKLLITNEYKEKYRPVGFHAFIAACRWAELEIRNLKS
jgi:CRISPR-associated protein Csm1